MDRQGYKGEWHLPERLLGAQVRDWTKYETASTIYMESARVRARMKSSHVWFMTL